MRVLVLDGNENQAVACVRSLARGEHRVEVGAETSWSKAGWSRSCGASFRYLSPATDATGFVACLAERAGRESGTLILPMTERSTLPISLHRQMLLDAGARLVLPPHETVLRAFDKRETTRLAQSLGLSVPRTLGLSSREEAEAASREFPLPAVLKPRSSQESDGPVLHATGAPLYARNADEFLRAYDTLRARCRDVLAQEWIDGQGCGYFALMRHGQLRASFAHRRLRDVRPTGSGSALRESVPPGAMRDGSLALLEALAWHGAAMVEFRVRPNGEPVFLEVNGRLWNSLALAVEAGVDFPLLLAQMAETGDVETPMPDYQTGLRCRWLLGDARHLIEVWKGAPPSFPGRFPGRFSALRQFVTPQGARLDNFRWHDPMPEIGDWLDFALHRLPGQWEPPRRQGAKKREEAGTMVNSSSPLGLGALAVPQVKGALHLHSTYSDGEFSLPELRQIFLDAGCSFACVTDHAEAFDEPKLEAYRRECEALSDEQFRFVAGLEYACEQRLHILGYGLTQRIASTEPQTVIRAIRDAGGVCVIAHPQDRFFGAIEAFETLPHGIEVWNTKYDGRYAPRSSTFALLRRLQRRDPATLAFYGQDLHWKRQFRGLFCFVQCRELSRDAILSALSQGDFAGQHDKGFDLPSDGRLAPETGRQLQRALQKALMVRRVTTRAKGVGKAMPAPVKAQLRRIF